MRTELNCVNVCGQRWQEGSRFKNKKLGRGEIPPFSKIASAVLAFKKCIQFGILTKLLLS